MEGRTLDDWKGCPQDGVQIVMRYFSDGTRVVMQGTRWYWAAPHPEGVVYDNDTCPLEDITSRYPGAIVKRGKTVPDGFYRRLVEEAFRSTWEAVHGP